MIRCPGKSRWPLLVPGDHLLSGKALARAIVDEHHTAESFRESRMNREQFPLFTAHLATAPFVEKISAIFIFTENGAPTLEVRMRHGAIYRAPGSWDHVSMLHQDLVRCSNLVPILPRTRLAVNPADIDSLILELEGDLPTLVVVMGAHSDARYRVRASYEPEGVEGVYQAMDRLLEALR